ncbi:MAG: DUF937 domain-containing protein [Oculatellaceae cyanobacterium Prado106]|jgi:hypothetical protein|nr:DUF937 domain-containing protein [Oculatellaceae cyanobacterium Prado106]
MPLLDLLMGAVSNPNQQASSNQLGTIFNTVQQLSGNHGVDASATQAILSALGGQVKGALQQQSQTNGPDAVSSIVSQLSGMNANPSAIGALFGGNQQQVVQAVSQQSGVNAGTIQAMLPALIPVVMSVLQSGALTQGAPGAQAVPGGNPAGGNPLLNAFLDSDRDGDTDLGDIMSMAGRFMQ